MPIIKRVQKLERTNVSIRIETELAESLKKYAGYTNVSTSEIVETAVRHVINSDHEFVKACSQNFSGKVVAGSKPKTQASAT